MESYGPLTLICAMHFKSRIAKLFASPTPLDGFFLACHVVPLLAQKKAVGSVPSRCNYIFINKTSKQQGGSMAQGEGIISFACRSSKVPLEPGEPKEPLCQGTECSAWWTNSLTQQKAASGVQKKSRDQPLQNVHREGESFENKLFCHGHFIYKNYLGIKPCNTDPFAKAETTHCPYI